MAQLSKLLTATCLTVLWAVRPRVQRWRTGTLRASSEDVYNSAEERDSEERDTLRAFVRRFPFWAHGRALLGEASLQYNDVATAYAEAQALRVLARKGSTHEGTALFILGRCFLRRGEPSAALNLFNEAHALKPHDHRIQEERSAAYALLGDRTQALEILRTIPAIHLSAESKAAMQWLVSGTEPAQHKH